MAMATAMTTTMSNRLMYYIIWQYLYLVTQTGHAKRQLKSVLTVQYLRREEKITVNTNVPLVHRLLQKKNLLHMN